MRRRGSCGTPRMSRRKSRSRTSRAGWLQIPRSARSTDFFSSGTSAKSLRSCGKSQNVERFCMLEVQLICSSGVHPKSVTSIMPSICLSAPTKIDNALSHGPITASRLSFDLVINVPRSPCHINRNADPSERTARCCASTTSSGSPTPSSTQGLVCLRWDLALRSP